MSWSSAQYLTFEAERTRPVRDLVQAVPTQSVASAVDLGCGPANSTEVIATHWPNAALQGIDNSADMVAAARKRMPAHSFTLADLSDWQDEGPFDLILSNAVLHWVPDHESLLPRLARRLTPRGTLAIQMPDNIDEPAHRLMRDIAAQPEFAAKLSDLGGTRTKVESPAWYFALLAAHCSHIDIWRTTYHHVLEGGPDAVVEWFKGSGLRPFLSPLDPAEQAEFLRRYRDGIAREYETLPSGATLLPFPRLFIIAVR
jgi:trans-aconitate 2-methyltransferase